jgi:hypothetical protein
MVNLNPITLPILPAEFKLCGEAAFSTCHVTCWVTQQASFYVQNLNNVTCFVFPVQPESYCMRHFTCSSRMTRHKTFYLLNQNHTAQDILPAQSESYDTRHFTCSIRIIRHKTFYLLSQNHTAQDILRTESDSCSAWCITCWIWSTKWSYSRTDVAEIGS